MDSAVFYNNVKRWIDSYRDSEPLKWLRRFIESSDQPAMVKDKLIRRLEVKRCQIDNVPCFQHWDTDIFLLDGHGNPKIYISKREAILEASRLQRLGYDVAAVQGQAFYRIKLVTPEKITNNQTQLEQNVKQ